MSELAQQLRLFITNTGPHARLEIGGELDLGNVHTLRDHLDLVVDAGTGNVDVDMTHVVVLRLDGPQRARDRPSPTARARTRPANRQRIPAGRTPPGDQRSRRHAASRT